MDSNSFIDIGGKKRGAYENIPYKLKEIEWEIPSFFSLMKDDSCCISPAFSLSDTSWGFKLLLQWKPNSKYMEIQSLSHSKIECRVGYSFGLKKHDGNIEQLVKEAIDNHFNLIKKKELTRKKSELVPNGVLTIICTVKFLTEITQSPIPDKEKSLELINLEKLSENFKELFANAETCDVTLQANDKEYKAHRSVLIARSSVFAENFKHDEYVRQTGVLIIPDCDSDSFQEFLEYLYCGKLDKISADSALNLYYTSDKYNVVELKTFCVKYLIQNLTVGNLCKVVAFASKYDEKKLFSAAQSFFNKNVKNILPTFEWQDFLEKNSGLANKLLIEKHNV